MDEGDVRARRETLFVAILLFLGSMFIIYPFLDSIVIAIAVSYLLSFFHRKINSRLNNELLSSIIVISSVLGFLILGLYFFINNAQYIGSEFEGFAGSLKSGVTSALKTLQIPQSLINQVSGYLTQFKKNIPKMIEGAVKEIPAVMIDIGIFLVTAIFVYRDRSKLKAEMEGILRGLPETEEKILRSLLQSIDSILRGVFVTQTIVAVVMAFATGIGFYLISLLTSPMPLTPLWSILIAIAALFPLIAGFMVYGPVGLYYMLLASQPIKGGLILIYGIIFLQIMPEIFLRPYVGSKSLDEHPLIIFLGFIAGPLVLGLKGLILGPLILILTKEFLFNYTNLVSSEPESIHSEDTED